MSIPVTYIVLAVLLSILAQFGLLYSQLNSQVPTGRDAEAPPAIACPIGVNAEAISRFRTFLQFPTVSSSTTVDHISEGSAEAFQNAEAFLEKSYPLVWSRLEVEKVGTGGHTFLLKWQGSDDDELPILFISHYDVVPAIVTSANAVGGEWLHPPFSGAWSDDGYIYGRGTLDVKYSVIALLEAVTVLLKEGFTPERSLYFTFGHDEEVGGEMGAKKCAALLLSRDILFATIVDEGGSILVDGVRPLVKNHPIAVVSTSEKVPTIMELSFSALGGHASWPPTDGSDLPSQMASFIARLKSHPPAPDLRAPVTHFLKGLVPYTNSFLRVVMWHCHAWPWRQILTQALIRSSRETASMVRTSVAVTRISAGVADNVLPQQGTITLNLRSFYDVSRETLIEYIEKTIAESKVTAEISSIKPVLESNIPTNRGASVASPTSPYFLAVKQSLQEIWRFGDDNKPVGVVPMLLSGTTDSRHYRHLSLSGVLRICPYTVNKTAMDVSRIHGTNERVRVEDFERGMCTYKRMMQLLSMKLVE